MVLEVFQVSLSAASLAAVRNRLEHRAKYLEIKHLKHM